MTAHKVFITIREGWKVHIVLHTTNPRGWWNLMHVLTCQSFGGVPPST
jgi:hypothetical protein